MKELRVKKLFNIYGFDGGNFDGNVYDTDHLAPAMIVGGGTPLIITDMEQKQKITLPKELGGKKFRIRRLTPREVLRLQDVEEKDIDTILNCGLSNSAIYKLAGNSITISPMYHLFRKMFIEIENENQQLSLF